MTLREQVEQARQLGIETAHMHVHWAREALDEAMNEWQTLGYDDGAFAVIEAFHDGRSRAKVAAVA